MSERENALLVCFQYDPAIRSEIHDIVTADINGDGKPDVVAMGDGEGAYWYAIPKDPVRTSWTKTVITADVLRRHLPPPYAEHEYFICGPNVMMDAIEAALGKLGVPISKYHSERYSFV